MAVTGHGPATATVSIRGPAIVTTPTAGSATLTGTSAHADQTPKTSWLATE